MKPSKTRPPTVMDPTEMSLAELYAQSLLDVVPDDAQAQDLALELESLSGLLESIPGATTLLAGWTLPTEQRVSLVERIFEGRVSEKVESFLAVLNRCGRMLIFPAAVRAFRKLLDTREGKIEVEVTTALPLDESQRAAIEVQLAGATAGKPIVRRSGRGPAGRRGAADRRPRLRRQRPGTARQVQGSRRRQAVEREDNNNLTTEITENAEAD